MLIKAQGDITLSINNESFGFSDINNYVEIDSEMMNVFKASTARNHTFTGDHFPVFVPGTNTVSWTGSVQRIEITPRWRTL
jgi:phage-related protein